MADVLTKEQRKKNMRNIRSKNTKIEILLRKALWNRGMRYRKNYTKIPGKPDIALTKYKVAVFCDSEFFHGENWEEQKPRILKGENGEFWVKKIEKNKKHDADVDIKLHQLGWIVLRFWGNDIKHNIAECVQTVEEAIMQRKLDE